MLDQANLNWSTGRLLSMCGALLCGSALIVHYKFSLGTYSALGVGLALGLAPLAFVLFQAQQALWQV